MIYILIPISELEITSQTPSFMTSQTLDRQDVIPTALVDDVLTATDRENQAITPTSVLDDGSGTTDLGSVLIIDGTTIPMGYDDPPSLEPSEGLVTTPTYQTSINVQQVTQEPPIFESSVSDTPDTAVKDDTLIIKGNDTTVGALEADLKLDIHAEEALRQMDAYASVDFVSRKVLSHDTIQTQNDKLNMELPDGQHYEAVTPPPPASVSAQSPDATMDTPREEAEVCYMFF